MACLKLFRILRNSQSKCKCQLICLNFVWVVDIRRKTADVSLLRVVIRWPLEYGFIVPVSVGICALLPHVTKHDSWPLVGALQRPGRVSGPGIIEPYTKGRPVMAWWVDSGYEDCQVASMRKEKAQTSNFSLWNICNAKQSATSESDSVVLCSSQHDVRRISHSRFRT
jgi:hypothetical protein